MAKRRHKLDPEKRKEFAEARERAGVTQIEASRFLGYTGNNTAARWESGIRGLTDEEYNRLMDYYRERLAKRTGIVGNVPRGTSGSGVLGQSGHNARRSLQDALGSHKAQVWLAEYRLELAKARTAAPLIEAAEELIQSRGAIGLFVGGRDKIDEIDWTDQRLKEAMEAAKKWVAIRLDQIRQGTP